MASNPLLSVCIPTYNRAPFLRECLLSIAPQIINGGLINKVDIIIADNASIDETEKVVAEFVNSYPGLITYFRNETNLGFDRSFTKLINNSQGTYCLCLGDDDAMFPDSLSYLVKLLEKNLDLGLVWVNNWGYSHDLKKQLLTHPNLRQEKDLRYESLESYIGTFNSSENLVGMFVGLSNQLFKRESWNAYPETENYLDTLAVHMYVSLTVFKEVPFMIVAKPIVKTRASNIRWNVFAGLETSSGRIKSTFAIATWISNTYNLPTSKTKLYFNIIKNEYWATFKESAKTLLHRSGLSVIITWYRQARDFSFKKS